MATMQTVLTKTDLVGADMKKQCGECGDENDLLEHPNYKEDNLCRECKIEFLEVEAEELESEASSLREEADRLKN